MGAQLHAGAAAGRPRRSWTTALGLALLGSTTLVAIAAPLLAPGDPFAMSSAVLQPPSWAHPFGTDDLGRDLLRAVVHGARISLIVAVASTTAGLALGLAVGALAGYAGGLVDDVLMRVAEVFQVIPRFFLVVATVALFGAGLGLLILVLALTAWPDIARLVRSQVLRTAVFDHVAAARAAGGSTARVLLVHVLPLTLPPIVAHASFEASGAILVEAGVSFLGLGDPTAMSWGALLHEAHHFLRVAWWIAVFPGLALTVTVLGLHLVADELADRW